MGFVVKHRGRWTARDESTLTAWLRWPNRAVDRVEVTRGLAEALAGYRTDRPWLYVCTGSECAPRRPGPPPDAADLAEAAARAGCAGASVTQCQGLCHRAPAAQAVDTGGSHRMVDI